MWTGIIGRRDDGNSRETPRMVVGGSIGVPRSEIWAVLPRCTVGSAEPRTLRILCGMDDQYRETSCPQLSGAVHPWKSATFKSLYHTGHLGKAFSTCLTDQRRSRHGCSSWFHDCFHSSSNSICCPEIKWGDTLGQSQLCHI